MLDAKTNSKIKCENMNYKNQLYKEKTKLWRKRLLD